MPLRYGDSIRLQVMMRTGLTNPVRKACFRGLGDFYACGGFVGANRPEIAVERSGGGVQNNVAIRAISEVLLDFAFHRWRELSL